MYKFLLLTLFLCASCGTLHPVGVGAYSDIDIYSAQDAREANASDHWVGTHIDIFPGWYVDEIERVFFQNHSPVFRHATEPNSDDYIGTVL